MADTTDRRPRDLMILCWEGGHHVEREGVDLGATFDSFEDALTHAKSIADRGAEIGTTDDFVYQQGKRGGWRRARAAFVERPPCAADCPNAGMDGACLHCGGGYRKVDPNRWLHAEAAQ